MKILVTFTLLVLLCSCGIEPVTEQSFDALPKSITVVPDGYMKNCTFDGFRVWSNGKMWVFFECPVSSDIQIEYSANETKKLLQDHYINEARNDRNHN